MDKLEKKKNGWELNNGLFEIYWEDNIAIKVKLEGVEFILKDYFKTPTK